MQRRQWMAMALAMLASAQGRAADDSIGVLTIVDGDVGVQRGAERLAAVEGLRLRADDIVTTGEGARLARVELDDGKTLDLGPGTQAMLQPQAFGPDDERASNVYVGRGWAKLSAPWNVTTPAALTSGRIDAQRVRGVVIVRVDRLEGWLYVESGVAAAQPRDGRRSAPYAMEEGAAFTQGPEGGSLTTRPAAERLSRLPRAFYDTLPRRAARFANAAVVPARLGGADAPSWVQAEPALRAAWSPRPAATRVGTRRMDTLAKAPA